MEAKWKERGRVSGGMSTDLIIDDQPRGGYDHLEDGYRPYGHDHTLDTENDARRIVLTGLKDRLQEKQKMIDDLLSSV